MNIVVFGIIVAFTLINISSYFVGLHNTPQFTTFLGSVHYPVDYLYYLSFIVQGKLHWLQAYNLGSGERTGLVFVNWMYTLGGHIGSLIHLDPPMIYQVMVVIGSFMYLVIAYTLMKLVFPKNTSLRLLAYVFFLISNAFPRIYQGESGWIFSYFYPFNNFGHPFVRLMNVPHHIYIQAAIMGGYVAAITFWSRPKKSAIAWLAIVGFFLASMQPLQWAWLTGILGVSGVYA